MLFNVLKRLAEKGTDEALAEKIDVFFAADKITKEQYDELVALINKGA